jgi:hypothetical protein
LDAEFQNMMVLSALRPDASLPEFLAHRARSASIRRLTGDIVIGVAAVVGAVWWTPRAASFLAEVGLLFAAYGIWGVGDRVRSRRSASSKDALRRIIDLLCVVTVVTGALAFAAILYSAWTAALGTWIS